jgi:uncharacterized SAM-binding protein YcdF (DUF218 family)
MVRKMNQSRFKYTLVFKVISALLLFISVFAALSYICVPLMEDYLVVDRPIGHADALVLMAGEMSTRLPTTAMLYREGKADKILLTNDGIFSAWSEIHQRNLFQVEWAEVRLLEERVPKEAIKKLAYTSRGTFYDALNARSYILSHRIDKILIVTSDYHTRRSLWTFERVFRGYPIVIGLYPVKSKLITSPITGKIKILLIEYLKLVYYKIRYSDVNIMSACPIKK